MSALLDIDSNYNATLPYSARHVLRANSGRLWVLVINSSSELIAYYSDDEGVTWYSETVKTGETVTNCCAAIDSSDKVYAVYLYNTAGVPNMYTKNRAADGSWSAETVITTGIQHVNGIKSPCCDIGPDDKLRIAWGGYWEAVATATNLYYTDSDATWPHTAVNLPERIGDANDDGNYPSLYVDHRNFVHILYGDAGGLWYKCRKVNGDLFDEEEVDTTGVAAGDILDCNIVMDKAKTLYAVWMNLRSPQAGKYNCRYASKTFGGSWSAISNLSNIAQHQRSSTIAFTGDGDFYVFWHGLGWGVNSGIDNVVYRKYSSGTWTPALGLDPASFTDEANTQRLPSTLFSHHAPPQSGAALVWIEVNAGPAYYLLFDTLDILWTAVYGQGQVVTDFQIRTPLRTTYQGIDDVLVSATIRRRINSATVATFRLFNGDGYIISKLAPNSRLMARFGEFLRTAHYQFKGYIPPPKNYANIVHIQGKPLTFVHEQLLALHGPAEVVLSPASDDYDEDMSDLESSDLEDMTKAMDFVMNHSSIRNTFKFDRNVVEITAYDFIAQAESEYLRYDEIDNLDNLDATVAMSMVIGSLRGTPLMFAGGGGQSNPRIPIGDTKSDWTTKLGYLKELISKMHIDTDFPEPQRNYFFYQSNHGGPYFVVKPYPSLITTPVVSREYTADDILSVRQSRMGGPQVAMKSGYGVDIGEVVYFDAIRYGLQGYYFLPEIEYSLTEGDINTKFVLDDAVSLRVED